ncbi:MAG: PhzF family phenazine biosynthesis protein [Acidimicrobiales bacterium]
MRAFSQVDVFTADPYRGNPLAVVLDGDGLSDDEMQRFANWTNLSETTFIVSPIDPAADYRVRIFTTEVELPFAGHPTLGTCHAWLEAGGVPRRDGLIVQECGIGLVTVRQAERLAFAAPPLLRSGPVDDSDLLDTCAVLGIEPGAVVAAAWADNGPGWIAVDLGDADAVIDLEPDMNARPDYKIGVVGTYPPGSSSAIEVRALFKMGDGPGAEDPVTGSLNAALAQWLLGSGRLSSPYVASQGTVLGRAGYVHVEEADGEIWIGGDVVTCVDGEVDL